MPATDPAPSPAAAPAKVIGPQVRKAYLAVFDDGTQTEYSGARYAQFVAACRSRTCVERWQIVRHWSPTESRYVPELETRHSLTLR